MKEERPVGHGHSLSNGLVTEVHCLGRDLPVDAVPSWAVDPVGDLDDHLGGLLAVRCGPVGSMYVNIFGEDGHSVLAECGPYSVHYRVDATEVESLGLILAVLPDCLNVRHHLA